MKMDNTVCPGSSDPFYIGRECPGSSDLFYIVSWRITTSWITFRLIILMSNFMAVIYELIRC